MDIYRKLQVFIFAMLIIGILLFSYLMYSWNFSYSKGTFTSEDGIYAGEFKGKVFNGHGTFIYSNGVKYEGQWNDGDIEGYGTLIFANGVKYEGEFKDGLYDGKGKITQPDGTVIEGIWKKGKLK